MEILCEVCGKKVDEDDCIYTMDSTGTMYAFCGEECYDSFSQQADRRSAQSMSGGSSPFGRGL